MKPIRESAQLDWGGEHMGPTNPICLPPAPLNGGKLETAPAKVGQWAWQPKIDDWRAVIHAPTRTVWNQYGKPMSIADKFPVALNHLRAIQSEEAQFEWLDVGMMQNRHDMMRGSIVILDLIKSGEEFCLRRKRLEVMFQLIPMATVLVGRGDLSIDRVYLIPQVIGESDGRLLYHNLQLLNTAVGRKFYEGVVCKKLDSVYPFSQQPKTQTPNWIKHRFDQ